jgi:hypothetical protein
MKHRRIIQGAGVDRELIVLSDVATMHEAAATGTEVTHRIRAACGFGRERLRSAGEPHCLARKSEKRDEAGAGGLAAIGATTHTGKLRLSRCFVTQGTAEGRSSGRRKSRPTSDVRISRPGIRDHDARCPRDVVIRLGSSNAGLRSEPSWAVRQWPLAWASNTSAASWAAFLLFGSPAKN